MRVAFGPMDLWLAMFLWLVVGLPFWYSFYVQPSADIRQNADDDELAVAARYLEAHSPMPIALEHAEPFAKFPHFMHASDL